MEKSDLVLTEDLWQDSFWKSVLLHVFPGLLTTVVFLGLKPLLEPLGYPSLLAFLLAIMFVDLSFMLGVLVFTGKKETGQIGIPELLGITKSYADDRLQIFCACFRSGVHFYDGRHSALYRSTGIYECASEDAVG